MPIALILKFRLVFYFQDLKLQEAEGKAAAAEERERSVNERLSQTLSRINVLEAQVILFPMAVIVAIVLMEFYHKLGLRL